jgi:hypothetical protein
MVRQDNNMAQPLKIAELAKSLQKEWLSKNRQMQGAQISRNEAYRGTPQ